MLYKGKYSLLVIIVALIAVIASFVVIERNKGPTESNIDDMRVIETTNSVQGTAYVKDTIYKGASLPAELFEIPFCINKDGQYTSNKELIEYLGSEEKVLPYLNTTNTALMLTFAQNGLAIKENAYRAQIEALYAASPYMQINGESLSVEEYALALYSMYVDNRIVIEGDFESDSSLVWQSEYMYYVRGILSITLKADERGMFEDTFGIPLNQQHRNLDLIVQVRFMPGNADVILGIDILGAIKR